MDEVFAHIALILAERIGLKTRLQWLRHYGSALATLHHSDVLTGRADQSTGLAQLKQVCSGGGPLWPVIENTLRWAEQEGHHLITLNDDRYPPLLKAIDDPPTLLFVVGDPSALLLPAIAIVGTRKPSPVGRRTAHRFALELCAQNHAVVSGLAHGIDKAAHEGAIAAAGITIGVMATGADRLYPAQHKALAVDILKTGGALITECPLGSEPTRAAFPQRNRIIAGLATGVLVVEAARRSGSLITADLAIGYNRDVFAIPGSIENTLSHGCHQLIKQGATLVESVGDILSSASSLLPIVGSHLVEQLVKPSGSELNMSLNVSLLAQLVNSPKTVDNLVDCCGLPAENLLNDLLELELEDYIESYNGVYHLTSLGNRLFEQHNNIR